jgi:hypothetical protein
MLICVLTTYFEMLWGTRLMLPSWHLCVFCAVLLEVLLQPRRVTSLLVTLASTRTGVGSMLLMCLIAAQGVNAAMYDDANFLRASLLGSMLPMLALGTLASPDKVRITLWKSQVITVPMVAGLPGLLGLLSLMSSGLLGVHDKWLIAVDMPLYQIVGDLYLVLFVTAAVLSLTQLRLCEVAQQSLLGLLVAAALAASAVSGFVFLQFIGSNKAPLAVLIAGVVAVSDALSCARNKPPVRLKLLLFFLGSLVFAIIPTLNYFDISTRLNEYGSGTSLQDVSSFSVRYDQVVEFLQVQGLANVTFFGELDSNNYVHSVLISTLTDLGLIGLLLAVIAFWYGCSGATARNSGITRVAAVSIIATGTVSSYFTWGPLWFLLGMLLAAKANDLQLVTAHTRFPGQI